MRRSGWVLLGGAFQLVGVALVIFGSTIAPRRL